MNDSSGAPAVHRASTVLGFLAFRGLATPAAMSAELGIAKSSMSDLLATMAADGFIQRREGGYTLGPLLTGTARAFVGRTDLLDRFALTWQRQRLLSEHTVSVQAFIGDRSLCTEVRHGAHLLPYQPRAGLRAALWHGAEGEPALRCLTEAQYDRLATDFATFSTPVPPETSTARRAWIARHARGAQRIPLVARTGNLEFSVPVTADVDSPPAVLTLHLPPQHEGYVPRDLRTAFEDAAAELTTR